VIFLLSTAEVGSAIAFVRRVSNRIPLASLLRDLPPKVGARLCRYHHVSPRTGERTTMRRTWKLVFVCALGACAAETAAIDSQPVDAGPRPADPCVAAGTCPPGVWIDVTPADLPAADLRPTPNAFGPGSIVGAYKAK
jgi:hypothetical protein